MAEAATQPRSAAPALLLRGVGRRFGGLHAVRDVDLEIADGERRAILGLNGAGKTTLFNVISGDFPPSAGTVELFGRDVTHLPARARAKLGLARTYQQARMLLGMSVEDSIYLSIVGVGARPPTTSRSCREEIVRYAVVRATPHGGLRSTTSWEIRWGRSHTASIVRSRSPWLSRRSQGCSCWTSPPPGCHVESGSF